MFPEFRLEPHGRRPSSPPPWTGTTLRDDPFDSASTTTAGGTVHVCIRICELRGREPSFGRTGIGHRDAFLAGDRPTGPVSREASRIRSGRLMQVTSFRYYDAGLSRWTRTRSDVSHFDGVGGASRNGNSSGLSEGTGGLSFKLDSGDQR